MLHWTDQRRLPSVFPGIFMSHTTPVSSITVSYCCMLPYQEKNSNCVLKLRIRHLSNQTIFPILWFTQVFTVQRRRKGRHSHRHERQHRHRYSSGGSSDMSRTSSSSSTEDTSVTSSQTSSNDSETSTPPSRQLKKLAPESQRAQRRAVMSKLTYVGSTNEQPAQAPQPPALNAAVKRQTDVCFGSPFKQVSWRSVRELFVCVIVWSQDLNVWL